MNKKKAGKTGKEYVVFLTLMLVAFVDQLVKHMVRKQIVSLPVIANTGSAFGLFKGANTILIFVSIMFIAIVARLYGNIPKKASFLLSVGLVIGGVLGNLIDRLWLGHVVDFIDLGFWPAFNIADSCIVVGAIIFTYLYLKQDKVEGKR